MFPINSSSPGQNVHHLTDETFKILFLNEKFCILILISLKFVLEGHIDRKSALVEVMAWHWAGKKTLPEPMLTQFTDTYMQYKKGDVLNQTDLQISIVNPSLYGRNMF